MGDYLFIDERPGPESGCVREWDVDEGSRLPSLWPSLFAMLTDIADDARLRWRRVRP
ncbi:hypothetical protein [Lentzea sp. NPDC055074]